MQTFDILNTLTNSESLDLCLQQHAKRVLFNSWYRVIIFIYLNLTSKEHISRQTLYWIGDYIVSSRDIHVAIHKHM